MIENSKVIPIEFGSEFVRHYARRLVKDPEVAIVELISNSSDAGANRLDILWPLEQHGPFTIRDDGTGMTHDEFVSIWNTLSYNRRLHHDGVVFPEGNTTGTRKLFGKNGKGRFSLFCFNNRYEVETSRGGERCKFRIELVRERRTSPITISELWRRADCADAHGTVITSEAFDNHLPVERLRELIGSKFLADPTLDIRINEEPIELMTLDGADRETVETALGSIDVFLLDSGRGGRTSHPHGVAWHVNGKAVGGVDWNDPNRIYSLDARTREAKQYTFIVLADILADYVDADWSGFEETDDVKRVLDAVGSHIQDKLNDIFFQKRAERKRTAIANNRDPHDRLPRSSRLRIGEYIDGIQTEVPTINQDTLNSIVKLLTNLEAASTGYGLLHQLAKVDSNDLDSLSRILNEWTVRDAELVLDELGRRLRLIENLEALVDQDVDELQVLHPLIEKGLWIFGAEYEGVSYTSNRGLRKVFENLLGDYKTFIDRPRLRPDIVAVAEAFSRDSFDDAGEVNGLEKVLILELKRGGKKVRESEMQEVVKYARLIAKSGNLVSTGKIVGFLIGSTLGEDTEPIVTGINEGIRIEARTYQTVIRQAHARTFHLHKKIKEANQQAT